MKKSKLFFKENRGMSYIELIVVLSIFSVMTSVALFNYGNFQAKVDIKNLASDIALKAVESQKSSVSGLFPPAPQLSLITSTWKPSYGLYFNLATNNKNFIYFTDVNNNHTYEGTTCTDECLSQISITKGSSISRIDVYYQGNPTPQTLSDLTISFTRPSSIAYFRSSVGLSPNIFYVQVTTVSANSSSTARIKVFSSGRIQVN
jgi:prepilin-type N-terminal cleavage/methylation domain-containing protein